MWLHRPATWPLSLRHSVAKRRPALRPAMEALWIGGATFFGLGTLVLEEK